VRGGQRRSRESWKTTLGSQGTWSENGHSDSPKRFNLLFLRVRRRTEIKLLMMKMIMCSENQCVTRPSDSDIMYWGIIPQNSVYIALPAYQMVNHVGGGKDTDGQHNTFGRLSWVSLLQDGSHHVSGKTRYFHTIILWLGKTTKAFFSIFGYTLGLNFWFPAVINTGESIFFRTITLSKSYKMWNIFLLLSTCAQM
jgi:hypothetical protein